MACVAKDSITHKISTERQGRNSACLFTMSRATTMTSTSTTRMPSTLDLNDLHLDPKVTWVIHGIALLLGVVGNLNVILLILRVPKLHTPSCFLMLAVALVELTLALVWNVTPLVLLSDDMEDSIKSSYACSVIGIIWQSMLTMSTFLHGAISFDRYFFIVHPLKYQRHFSNSRITIGCVVLLSLSITLPTAVLFVGHEPFHIVAPIMTCNGSSLWIVLFFALQFFPSVIFSTIAYQRIWMLCSKTLSSIEFPKKRMGSFRTSVHRVQVPSKLSNPSDGERMSPTVTVQCQRSGNQRAKFVNTLSVDYTSPSSSSESSVQTLVGNSFSRGNQPDNVQGVLEATEKSASNTRLDNTASYIPEYGILAEMRPLNDADSGVVSTSSLPCQTPTKENLANKRPLRQVKSSEKASDTVVSLALDRMYDAVRTTCAIALTPNLPRRAGEDNKRTILKWVAVCNPLVLWMMSLESGDQQKQGANGAPKGKDGRPSMQGENASPQTRRNIFCAPISHTRRPTHVRNRRLRALALVLRPVLGHALSYIPLLVVLLLWELGIRNDVTWLALRVVSHVSYFIIPLRSLVSYMTNRPFRYKLMQQMMCHKVNDLSEIRVL